MLDFELTQTMKLKPLTLKQGITELDKWYIYYHGNQFLIKRDPKF